MPSAAKKNRSRKNTNPNIITTSCGSYSYSLKHPLIMEGIKDTPYYMTVSELRIALIAGKGFIVNKKGSNSRHDYFEAQSGEGGIAIGCMHFGKAASAKLRTFASLPKAA